MAQPKVTQAARRAGRKIIAAAHRTLFPLPEDVDPDWVAGVLIGTAAALEAVGYPLEEEST